MGGQGGCERRNENQKIKKIRGWGLGGREDSVKGGWMWTKNLSYCENEKNIGGGGGQVRSGWGWRVEGWGLVEGEEVGW